MYVINPPPASQDLQPTASSYVAARHSESIELEQQQQQQQHKEILSQILTKCNADMSDQVANFSCPDEKTPPRSAAVPVKEEAKSPASSSPAATPAPSSSPCSEVGSGHGAKPTPAVAGSSPKEATSAPAGECKTGRRTDGEIRSPLPTLKRSPSLDGSPLSSASSSNAASLSPSSLDGPAKSTPPKSEPMAEPVQSLAVASPVSSNFSSVVHPKERALKSIAAAAASNERNNATNGGSSSSSSTPAKPASKAGAVNAGGRAVLNGTGPSATGTGTTAHGGRLQFFKDGKFILELARAREGEKTSWISVPRKTYWPPTVSSTSANFHKHESSTSLSFSDDNSSIQSSPWQRDHCWKQANPRPNISKELSLYYFRPLKARGHLTHDTRSWCRRKRRRPYDSHLPLEIKSKPQAQKTTTVENGNAKKDDSEHKEAQSATGQDGETTENLRDKCNGTTLMDTSEGTTAAGENNAKKRKGTKQDEPMVGDDDHKQSNGHHPPANGGTHCRPPRCKRPEGKDLASIIKTLVEHQQTKSINAPGASAGAGTAIGPFRLGTIPERGNSTSSTSFRSSVFASSAASQHVSPRKRILREMEKVSLDDAGSCGTSSTKRSRPKAGSAAGTPVIVTATTATPLSTLTTNGTGSPLNGGPSSGSNSSSSSSNSNSKTNGHLNGSGSIANGTTGAGGKQPINGAGSGISPVTNAAPPVPAPVSRPFSSYSITSLLGHNTSSSGETSSSANFSPADAMQRKTDVSVASVTSTASHNLYHHPQHPLSPHHQYQGSLYLGKEPLAVGSKSPVMAESLNHAHYQGQLGSTRYGYGVKKRSPSYGGGGGTAASPGANSGGSSVDPCGNTIRSPDLSPSPEHHHQQQPQHQHQHQQQHQQQQSHTSAQHSHHGLHHTSGSASSGGFSRYRQHPYGGSPSSYSSAPSSSRFSPSPSTNDSATTPPYSGSVAGAATGGARSAISYRPGYQLGGSSSQGHSPPTSNGSPQHYSRASPLNFGRGTQQSPPPPLGSQHHNRTAGTSSSPRASPSSGGGGVTTSHASTPTSAMASLTTGASLGTTIRTVPKKTAALRQPFSGGHSPSSSSPSRERSNSNASSSSHKKDLHPEGSDSVDGASLNHYGTTPSSPAGVIRPNTVIASPTAHHPVPNAFYPLYQATQLGAPSSSSLMNAAAVAAATSSVPFHPATLTYYQQMYTAATMAAYRTPLWMHYPGLPGVAPHGPPHGPPHMIQPHHQAPPPSSVAPNISSADRRLIDRSPPTPPPPPPQPASGSSITDPAESQRLQHSILATPSSTAALNYSVTALSSSSRDIINGGSAFTSPSGSSWPTDAVGYQHHPDHSARSTAAVSGIASATAKDETSNDVPLNLSKH
ncbi:protein hairless-like isoform X2 [Anopheles merus]|uniref:protein hairless-like isoform X2 n=1 Tax=Anopheles merus TaxID=30066 RepID=UPI001BE4972D|nr:protein hairless-like isoform X2 [Anopheles merus]